MKSTFIAVLVTVALSFAAPIKADEFGTPAQAEMMLEAAVDAVRSGKQEALTAFNEGQRPFREGDLYVFCADTSSGKTVAHGGNPDRVGDDFRTLTDSEGKAYAQEMLDVAVEGEFKVVDYRWPRPGEEDPRQKSSYVTLVDGLLCGVGYYK